MGKRLELQIMLEDILGSRNVYFQPPPSVKLKYPCIVYSRNLITTDYADNNPYTHKDRYQLTLIDRDPDSIFPGMLSRIQTSAFDRSYTTDNLNHTVFNIYY